MRALGFRDFLSNLLPPSELFQPGKARKFWSLPPPSQILQYPLIKEYTLDHIRDPTILNVGILESLGCEGVYSRLPYLGPYLGFGVPYSNTFCLKGTIMK